MEANDATITEQQQLVSDMKSVIADAEDMLAATADQAGEKVASLRARIPSGPSVIVHRCAQPTPT